MRIKALLIIFLVVTFLTSCTTSQLTTAERTLPRLEVTQAPATNPVVTPVTKPTVWSKGTVVIPGNPTPWIAVSGGTFGQCTCVKGSVCCYLRVETVGTAEWIVNDPSILELKPTNGSKEVTITPLKEGQYVITVTTGGTATTVSGRVFEKGSQFVHTMYGD